MSALIVQKPISYCTLECFVLSLFYKSNIYIWAAISSDLMA